MKTATKQQTAINEKPILFSTPMVKAILDGRKTQTRRIVKIPFHPDTVKFDCVGLGSDGMGVIPRDKSSRQMGHCTKCPYGKVGDRLWVRETWQDADWNASNGETVKGYFYRATHSEDSSLKVKKWKPSIFMPRWASRITLEITNIRVERLMEITARDVKREGFPSLMTEESHLAHFEQFEQAWNKINGADSWSANPFVWVIEFKKL